MHKIALAPTTLPNSPPLEYIDAAVQAGYDGIGIRLFRSPGITYAFHPVTGNPTLMRDVKSAIARAGLEVFDVLSFYLQPAMDLDSMLPPLAFGAEIGAQYALAIGDDPEWARLCDNFGRFCDAAARLGWTAALEAPVNSRTVNTLPLALQMTPQDVLQSPTALVGSVDAIVEQLHAWREQCDVSYVIVPSRLMDALAPVIARIAGT